jgi:hypothetical protein
VVVIVGDGAEWIWNRASMFVRRCEILDFWHALEHAREFARLRYGVGSAQADRWAHDIAEKLRDIGGVGYPITYLGAFCGLRRAEVLGLRFVSIRWFDNEIRVQYAISKRRRQGWHSQM